MKKVSSIRSILFTTLVLCFLGHSSLAQVLNQPVAADNPNLAGNSAWTAACASDSFNEYFVNFTWSPPLVDSSNEFVLELSDADGNFGSPIELARLADKNTTFDFEFQFAVPNTVRGENYRMRVRSTSPAKTSPASDPYPMHYVDYDSPLLISRDGNGIIPPGGNIQLCAGESLVLATHNIPNAETYQYNWYRSTSLLSEKSNELTITTPGTYWVELDYGTVCSGSANTLSNTIAISNGTSLGIALNEPSTISLCAGDSQTLTANVSGMGLNYTWYKDGAIVSGPTVDADTFTVNTSSTDFGGDYQVEISGGSACTELSAAVTIQNAGSTQVTLNNPENIVLLPGNDETLSVSTNAVTPTYQWFKDNVLIPGATSASLTISDIGDYKVTVTETGGSCAGTPVDSPNINVVLPASFEVDIAYDGSYTECQSSSATVALEAIYALDSSGNRTDVTSSVENNFSYQWVYDSNNLSGATASSLNLNDANENGEYQLIGTLGAFNATSNALTVRLATTDVVTLSSTETVLCEGGAPIILTSSLDLSGETFEWLRDGSSVDTSSGSFSVTNPGTYQLRLSRNNCATVSNEIEIQRFDDSLLVLDQPNDIIIIEGETQTVNASGATSYEWFDANNTSLGTQSSFGFQLEGQYLLLANFGNCSVSRVITVTYRDNFAIPNVITANGDGINDQWVLPNSYSRDPEVLVTIFDEKGKEVFSQANYENNWPQSSTSFSQQNMIFYYRLTRAGRNLKQGTITVIR
ncbi:MAG: gliding motility-associated C-terminal domain-containing protein [Bacteroidota bacterium]